MKSLVAVGLSVALLSTPLLARAGDGSAPPAPSRIDRAADWIGNHLGITGALTMVTGGAAVTWGVSVYLEAAVALAVGATVSLPLDLAFVAVGLGITAFVVGKAMLEAWAEEPDPVGANLPRNAATSVASAVPPLLPGTGGVGVTR